MKEQTASLFRQEALTARRGDWLGTIDLALPVSYRALAIASLSACIVVTCFLAFGHYTRHEQATGRLIPSLGLLTNVAPSAGTVTRAIVREGEVVSKDQALVEISTELDSLVLGRTRTAISEELRAQRTRNLDALNDQERLSTKKQEALHSGIALLRQQLVHIDAQIALQVEQAQSATKLLNRFQGGVEAGVVSGTQIEQQRSTALSAQAAVPALQRQRGEIEQQLLAQEEQLRQLPLSASLDRVALRQKVADIDQTLAENESQRAIVLRAAQPGVVSNVMVKDGETVAAGQRLLSLIPQGSELQAEFWLPSRAVGFVAPGARVVLRYQAFPYQKFGQQIGIVADVSRSASGVEELSALLGKKIDEPLYRVIVTLPQQTVLAYGHSESLKPSMALDADILLDRRRLFEWVFEPLFGFGRSVSPGS